MANTSAATMATAQEQRQLADAALDAGADTAYSATEAAAAQEELAKAGQSVADITGGSLAGVPGSRRRRSTRGRALRRDHGDGPHAIPPARVRRLASG